VLLISIGVLLATGQLWTISQWSRQTPLAQWTLRLEEDIREFFVGR